MTHNIFTYLKHLIKSFHLHGIHSPFVYEFQRACLYDKQDYPAYGKLAAYRKALLQDSRTISVTDFGAGSRIFKSNERKIKDIARHAGARARRMRLLYRVTTYFKSQTILDIGTSVGLGTFALSQSGAHVTTLEGCPQTQAVAIKAISNFQKSQPTASKRILPIVGDFDVTIPELLTQNPSYDLVYFDGNHSFEATVHYAQQLLPTVHNDTVWVFDDIHLHKEMTRAWNAIKELPQIQVTVDCYWLGFVFFRKEQAREHFYVRL